MIAQKPGSCEKHNIKSSQEREPGAVESRLLGEERGGGVSRGDQQRREQREQEQREEEFAHAGVGGNRGENRAGDGEAESAQDQDENQAPDDACQREIVEDGEDWHQDEFG